MKKEKAAEKRKLVELGVIEKPVSKKLAKQGMKTPFNATIVIDLGFDDLMSEKVGLLSLSFLLLILHTLTGVCCVGNQIHVLPVGILLRCEPSLRCSSPNPHHLPQRSNEETT